MKILMTLAALPMLTLTLTAVKADENAVKDALAKSMPNVKIDSIKPSSEVKGLFEVTVGANIFYMSEDGKFLLQGRLVDIEAREDLTEKKLSGIRKADIEKVGEDKMVIFKAKIPRYKAYVFTDIDCGYCRKLHSEIDQYLAQGISIEYLFFPRAGKGSESYDKAVSVWCSKDRNTALTEAKKGNTPKVDKCENPVDEHMQLAEDFEIRGTPFIVSENGAVFAGYIPAKQLAEELESEKAGK
ncbi:MAG: DsbC family protein [Gammaproteobacteria bacterium]